MTPIRKHFRSSSEFAPAPHYRLLPLRFGRLDQRRYIVTNDVGEYVLLSRDELSALVERRLPTDSELYRALKARHFLFDEDSDCALDLLALKYRSRADQVANFTGLHIFVLTLRCDHSCRYCQVSRQLESATSFDMQQEHAELALEFMFRSPSPNLKLEFQGGEPLLNFKLLRWIVERALDLNRTHRRRLQFVIASNLANLNDDVLAFAREHEIYFSTSLDGPQDLHDAQRPRPNRDGYERTIRGIERIRAAVGPSFVSALMTPTQTSLGCVEQIIDEYVARGFHSIFLRSLSPFGFAVRNRLTGGASTDAWLAFYQRGLQRILDVNYAGYPLREEYSTILLQKLFSPRGSNYVDLQSPAGIGIGALVFNYDGSVYASDEARMLAEMNDHSFRLGRLGVDSYDAMMTSDALLDPLASTLLESSPMCSDCPYLPFCGADPVFHQATQRDPMGHKAFSGFCAKQMGAISHLLTRLEDDPHARRVLQSWV